jgi:hypothetical protein
VAENRFTMLRKWRRIFAENSRKTETVLYQFHHLSQYLMTKYIGMTLTYLQTLHEPLAQLTSAKSKTKLG